METNELMLSLLLIELGLSKRIETLGKQRNCEVVLPWRRSSVNHLYWCGCTSKSGEEAVEKWKSITNHVQNVHHHDSGLFPVCAHAPLDERSWLRPSKHLILDEILQYE